MKYFGRMPTENIVSELGVYLRDASKGGSIPIHIYNKKKDISYFIKNEQGKIEINSYFNENDTYRLTISQNSVSSTITLETKFLDDGDGEIKLDCEVMLKQNRKEIEIFLMRV